MFDIRYTNDIVLLIWIGIAALLSKSVIKKKVTVLGQEEERYSLLFAVIVFFPIFWFVTTVFMRGDMYTYQWGFNGFNMSVGEVFQNWNSVEKGPGFSLLVAFSKSIGITNFQQFRVLLALLQSIPLVLVFRKYSDDYIFSVFLFITNMCYDSWMMNGLRQFLAACIVLLAFPFVLKKRYIFAIPIVFLAVTVHRSALIMIPVLFLTLFNPWKKLTIVLLLAFTIVVFFYVRNPSLIGEEASTQSKGLNPIRLVINLIPVVIAFIGRKKIEAANNRVINACINISLANISISIVAMFTSGIMAGRLSGYTTLYTFILFPYLCHSVFNERISKNIRILLIVFYILHFFIYLIWG